MSEGLLPPHGPIACRKCWSSHDGLAEYLSDNKRFKLVNDPAAWGAQNPTVLVLGITKGNTQATAMEHAAKNPNMFDEVAYKDFRPRLTTVLKSVGLAKEVTSISQLISKDERNFGWGSVVRCSLTGLDKKKNRYSGESGKVLPAFSDMQMSKVVSNCLAKYLADLPSRLRLIVLLGNSNGYLRKMSRLVSRTYGHDFETNPADEGISYTAAGRLWVHVGHPSRGNGYYNNFLEDPPTIGQGKKRELAKRAIERLSLA